jgi:hypothetical protein
MLISLIHVLVLFAIAFMVSKSETRLLKKIFWSGFVLKLAGGIALGLIYIHYYQVGDTLTFYADGVRLANQARQNFGDYMMFLLSDTLYGPWVGISNEPRTIFMSKIVSMFCLIAQDNYWIISLYFSAVSFFSAWYLVKIIIRHRPDLMLASVIAFLFLPTALFWSSGIIKETLSMACLYFISTGFMKLWTKQGVHVFEWIVMLVCCWVVWKLKYYYLVVFLPLIAAALIMKRIIFPRVALRNPYYSLVIWLMIFSIPVYAVGLIRPNLHPQRFLEVIASSNQAFVEISAPEDLISYPDLQPTAWNMLKYMPRAIFSGLFRPFLWEAGNFLQLLAAFENLVILIIFLYSLKSVKKIFHSPDRLLIFSMLIYILLLAAFLALSTPNFGTLARYRVGFISFFALLITADNPLVDRLQKWLMREGK